MIYRNNKNTLTKREHFWQRYKIHIAATGFAIIIWFLIVSDGVYDYEATVPIEMPVAQQHLAITTDLPSSAKIKVRGQGLALLALMIFREGKLELKMDWEPGKKTIYPSTDQVLFVGSAKNLSVLQINEPTEIPIEIEPLTNRILLVSSRVRIKPAAGYTAVGDVTVVPNKIILRGGESLLNGIDSIATEEIVFDKLKNPFSTQVSLVKPVQTDKLIIEPTKVVVSADIQKLMEKKITNIPVTATNLPTGMHAIVIPAKLSLVAEGGVNIVANLSEKDLIATIDYNRYQGRNQTDFPAYIKPVSWVRYRDIEPKRFKVVLEKE